MSDAPYLDPTRTGQSVQRSSVKLEAPVDLLWSGTMGSTQAMEPGDMYEIEISGVGTLSNKVVQGK